MSPLLIALLQALVAALLPASCLSRTDRIVLHSGLHLNDLPGHVVAQGRQPAHVDIEVALVDVLAQGPKGPDGRPLASFTAKAYKTPGNGRVRTFGPTIRVRPGQAFSIKFTNDLVAGPEEQLAGYHMNHLTMPSWTNLHLHGIWGDPGLKAQPQPGQAVEYTGHDNIFVPVAPRPNASVAHGSSLTYHYQLPRNYMPGFAWYHPHFHGSSAVQTATAKGVVIVEGEEQFLTEEGGCGPLRAVLLGGIKEWVMQIEGWFFGGTATPGGSSQGQGRSNLARPESFDSYPDLSARHEPRNPTCCGEGAFVSAGQDFLTINGGYQPVVPMSAGVWQRWRLVYTAYMRYVDLTLTTTEGQPAPCELQLLAKDGVFLQQIPRAVHHVLLPPGGRADLLVCCSGTPGARYLLRSGFGPMSEPPPTCDQPSCRVMTQGVVAVVKLQEGLPGPTGELAPEGCTPLRPSQVADLRDPALEAAGVDKGALVKGSIMFFPAMMGDMAGVCTVNGELFSFPDSKPLVAPLGSVVEWVLMQSAIHPHHLHTVPFQIVGLPDLSSGRSGSSNSKMGGRRLQQLSEKSRSHMEMMRRMGVAQAATGMAPANEAAWANLTDYFRVGDYHDTLLLPTQASMGGGSATVRFQPGIFTGYSVAHCHYLQHEDQGCMKVVKWECPGYEGNEQPERCQFEYPVKGTLPWGPDGARQQG